MGKNSKAKIRSEAAEAEAAQVFGAPTAKQKSADTYHVPCVWSLGPTGNGCTFRTSPNSVGAIAHGDCADGALFLSRLTASGKVGTPARDAAERKVFDLMNTKRAAHGIVLADWDKRTAAKAQ